MSDGTRVRRKESTGRAKSMNIGGRGARLEGNKMNIIAMKEKKNVFITVMRGDGKRPVRSAAVHSLRQMVRERVASEGKEKVEEARRELERDGRESVVTRLRQDEEILGREDAIPLRRVSRWPKEVERERGG